MAPEFDIVLWEVYSRLASLANGGSICHDLVLAEVGSHIRRKGPWCDRLLVVRQETALSVYHSDIETVASIFYMRIAEDAGLSFGRMVQPMSSSIAKEASANPSTEISMFALPPDARFHSTFRSLQFNSQAIWYQAEDVKRSYIPMSSFGRRKLDRNFEQPAGRRYADPELVDART